MSYDLFKNKVAALIRRSGEYTKVCFSTDHDTGKHRARFPDGTIIVGNSICHKVTVLWGSGHQAIATI